MLKGIGAILGEIVADVRDDALIQFNVLLHVFSAERLGLHQDLRP